MFSVKAQTLSDVQLACAHLLLRVRHEDCCHAAGVDDLAVALLQHMPRLSLHSASASVSAEGLKQQQHASDSCRKWDLKAARQPPLGMGCVASVRSGIVYLYYCCPD